MWLIPILILIATGCMPKSSFLDYRLNVGVPLNVIDGLMIVGLVSCLFVRQPPSSQFNTTSKSIFRYYILVFALMVPIALFAAMISKNPVYFIISDFRDYLTIPITVLIAYKLCNTFAAIRKLLWVWLGISLVSGSMLLMNVVTKGSQTLQINDITQIREGNEFGLAVYYVLPLGCGLLYMHFMNLKVKYIPKQAMLLGAVFCYLVVLMTFYRSSWLNAVLTTGVLAFLLPKGQRVKKMLPLMITSLVGLFGVYMSLWLVGMIIQHDLTGPLVDRMRTLLPGQTLVGKENFAFDSRTEGMGSELRLWIQSPFWGHGFGYWMGVGLEQEGANSSFRHNVLTSALALGGPLAMMTFLIITIGPFLVAKKLIAQVRSHDMVLMAVIFCTLFFSNFLVLGMSLSLNSPVAAAMHGIMVGLLWRFEEYHLAHLPTNH